MEKIRPGSAALFPRVRRTVSEEGHMKFFVDTAEVDEIRDLAGRGLLDGVTTNPSLVAKSGRDFKEVIAEICSVTPGPVSAEVAAMDHETMLKEGRLLARIADNVVVKVPLTPDGLQTCKALRADGTDVNVTLCFSANQAILAAKCGATYVSPFIGRLDDINLPGMDLIADIRTIYDNYGFETEILAASIRSANHVSEAALAGADVATIPHGVIMKMFAHPLTEKGLAAFVADWKKTGQSIL
jgi:transaldolase